MLGFALALSAASAWGVADFAGGVFSRGRPAVFVVLGAQGAAVIALAVLVPAAGLGLPKAFILSGVLGGISSGCAAVLLYRALAIGPMGVVAPIFALSAAIPVIVGFASGDHASALQGLGMIAAIGGCVLAARAPGGGEPIRVQGILTAIAATVCVGLGLVGLHAAAQTNAIWALQESRVAELLTVIAIAVSTQLRGAGGRVWPGGAIVTLGLIDMAASYAFVLASRHGTLVLVSVLASIYPVITIVLAWAILHEVMRWPQRLGVFAAFAGVTLLVAG
jgi:drug/metabolite transporter (DMT)-like permease